MPCNISWYIDKRVIKSRYSGSLTDNEIVACGDELETFVQSGIQPLFLVLDMLEVKKFPTNPKPMLQRMSNNRAENQIKWVFVLSNNTLLNFFNALASKVMRVPVRVCKSQDEADTIIARMAPDLAPELPQRTG